MEHVKFKSKQVAEIVLDGKVIDLVEIVETSDCGNRVSVRSMKRDPNNTSIDDYCFLIEGNVHETETDKIIGNVPSGWRLLVQSTDKENVLFFDPFSEAYELRLVQVCGLPTRVQ